MFFSDFSGFSPPSQLLQSTSAQVASGPWSGAFQPGNLFERYSTQVVELEKMLLSRREPLQKLFHSWSGFRLRRLPVDLEFFAPRHQRPHLAPLRLPTLAEHEVDPSSCRQAVSVSKSPPPQSYILCQVLGVFHSCPLTSGDPVSMSSYLADMGIDFMTR